MSLRVAYLPLGRITFDMVSANACYQKSVAMLEKMGHEVLIPAGVLTSPEEMLAFMDSVDKIDLVVFQTITFIDNRFVVDLLQKVAAPLVIWAVREPAIDGGWLRLNSLTGAFSNGCGAGVLGHKTSFLFGNPEEEAVEQKLGRIMRVLAVVKKLKNLHVGIVGNTPPGYSFGDFDELQLRQIIGPKVTRIEMYKLLHQMKAVTDEEINRVIKEIFHVVEGLENLPQEQLKASAAFYFVVKRFAEENKVDAITSRCWPDTFEFLNFAPCGALGLLNDAGIPTSCEADFNGVLTQVLLSELTDSVTYFADPVSLDEKRNALIFWHCGTGACSLARPGAGPRAGVHPNRKVGLAFEFGLKPGRVTIARLGKKAGGYRLLIAGGEALDEPQKFLGTSVEVQTDYPALKLVTEAVEGGWEPHYALVYGDVREELCEVAKYLGIETVSF